MRSSKSCKKKLTQVIQQFLAVQIGPRYSTIRYVQQKQKNSLFTRTRLTDLTGSNCRRCLHHHLLIFLFFKTHLGRQPTMSSSSFFTVPGSGKKRKRAAPATTSDSTTKKRRATAKTNATSSSSSSKPVAGNSRGPSRPAASAPQKKSKQKAVERDESISGSDSEDYDDPDQIPERGESGDESDASDGKELTAAERRLRLAERYLANVREEVDDYGFDAADLDKDLIAERLQEDVAEAKGRVYRNLSTELDFEKASQCVWRWNSDVITSIAACGPYAYTVSRDIYLTKFKIQDLPQHQWPQTTKKKPQKPPAPPKRRPDRVAFRRGNTKKAKDRNFKGHTDSILAVAVSHDGKFVATGGEDSRIVLWDAEKLVPLRTFFHHRDAVTGLAWRRGTHQLYSSSKDRTVKIWSMDEQAYVDTLYGHQDSIVDVSSHSPPPTRRPVFFRSVL